MSFFVVVFSACRKHQILILLRKHKNLWWGKKKKKKFVRSGIRTHAWRTRLRPERSALDRSAILTWELRATKEIQVLTGHSALRYTGF